MIRPDESRMEMHGFYSSDYQNTAYMVADELESRLVNDLLDEAEDFRDHHFKVTIVIEKIR